MSILTSPELDVDAFDRLLLSQQLKCKASFHPEHTVCEVPAVYVLHLVDEDHSQRYAVPLCEGHAPGYYLVAVRGTGWCVCNEHRLCEFGQIKLMAL